MSILEFRSGFSLRVVLDKLSGFFILAAVFAVPLWFSYFFPTYYIFELNKTVLLRVLVIMTAIVGLIRLWLYPAQHNYSPGTFFKRYWLWPTFFILGWALITVTSPDPVLSFYGLAERQQGLLSYLFYFLWFIFLSFYLLDDPGRRKLRGILISMSLSALLISVYAILQIFNLDFLNWPEEPYLTLRAFSTLGQPNFLASWLLLALPISVYLYRLVQSNWAKSFYLFITLVQVLALLASGSRGGILALIIMILATAIYYLWSRYQSVKSKLMIGVVIAASLALLLLAVDFLSQGRMRELVQLNFNQGSVGARVNLYRAAWLTWPERPWLGHGLENADDIFIRYYAPDWGIYGNVSQSADRAHNLFLDILLAGGLLGLLLWLSLIAWFYRLVRIGLSSSSKVPLIYFLAWGAVAYLLSLFFSFSFVSGEFYFWSFLALLVAEHSRLTGLSAAVNKRSITLSAAGFLSGVKNLRSIDYRRRLKQLVLAVLVLVSVGLLMRHLFREFKVLLADYYFRAAQISLAAEDYSSFLALDRQIRLQSTYPINQEAYDMLLADLLSFYYPEIKDPALKQVMADKLQSLATSLPNRSYRHLLSKARANRSLGQLLAAETSLQALSERAPTWPTLHYEWGLMAEARSDWLSAQSHYLDFLALLPAANDQRLNSEHSHDVAMNYYRAYLRLANLKNLNNDYEGAAAYYRLAYQHGSFDFTLLKKIADTYYLRGDLDSALRYNLHGLARQPRDYAWSLALAILYYQQGDLATGLEYARQVAELAPAEADISILYSLYDLSEY